MLIVNGKIITWGPENQIMPEGKAILIQDGLIRRMGDQAELIRDYPDEERSTRKGSL